MAVVGHERITRVLALELPQVSLFVGPDSVGKWTAAEWLRREHAILDGDLLRIRRLTVDDARTLVRFASIAPVGARKLAIVRLDRATPASLHILLKSLEEAHESVRFILIAREKTLPTVVSRAEVFQFSLLTTEQVTTILLKKNFKPVEAKRYAELSGGHVSRALAMVEGMDAKITVLSAVRALRERDAVALDNHAGKWEDKHTELLAELCREVITGRWRVFSDAETEGMGRKLPLRILTALRQEIRPRLVVRYSLMSVLKGDRS